VALTLPDHLKRLAERDDLPVPTRYAAERLHELCAPGTHFAYSAAFLIDPVTAVHELVVCSETFLRESEFRFPAMLSSLRNTKWLLTSDANLKDWFSGRREALLTAIDDADQVPRELEQEDARAWLEEKVRDLVLPAARELRKELKADGDGYRRRLLDQVCLAMQGDEPATPGAWIKFDKSLGMLASMLLTDGRVGAQIAERLAAAIGDAASPAEAADRLRLVVNSEKEEFEVAIVIRGASRLEGVDAFGFRYMSRPCCWADAPDAHSDGRLRSFMARLTDGQQACGVVVKVSAYDPAQARQRALKQATELRDSLHARYRTCRFTIHTTVLVRAADRSVTRQESTAGGVSVASPLTDKPEAVLRDSLRYAGEARDLDGASCQGGSPARPGPHRRPAPEPRHLPAKAPWQPHGSGGDAFGLDRLLASGSDGGAGGRSRGRLEGHRAAPGRARILREAGGMGEAADRRLGIPA